MPVSSQETERSCICVLGVYILLISTIFLFDFGTVSTDWYFLFFISSISFSPQDKRSIPIIIKWEGILHFADWPKQQFLNSTSEWVHLACSEYTSHEVYSGLCLFLSIVYSVFQRCPTRDEISFPVVQSNCKKGQNFQKFQNFKILQKIQKFKKK